MSNFLGYGITALVLALFISSLVSIKYLDKNGKNSEPIKWFMVFLPTLYLAIINEKWLFGLTILPSQNGPDLTYGPFHIASLIVMVASVFLIAFRVKDDQASTRRFFHGRLDQIDVTVLKIGVMLIGIEVYKQLVYLNLMDGLDNYSWYGFPLQFCSTPFLLYTIVPLIRNKKIKDTFYSFIGIFTFVAGLAVMVIGDSVFTIYVSISVHTMLWHGSMVVIGFYVLLAKRIGVSWKQFFQSVLVLTILVIFVQGINVLFHYSDIEFDGFFINPWLSTENMPVLSDIRITLQAMNLPVWAVGVLFSLIYIFVFSLGGFVVFIIARVPYALKQKVNQKKVRALAY